MSEKPWRWPELGSDRMMRSSIQRAEMSFPHGPSGFGLNNRWRSLVTREGLRVELALLCIKAGI